MFTRECSSRTNNILTTIIFATICRWVTSILCLLPAKMKNAKDNGCKKEKSIADIPVYQISVHGGCVVWCWMVVWVFNFKDKKIAKKIYCPEISFSHTHIFDHATASFASPPPSPPCPCNGFSHFLSSHFQHFPTLFISHHHYHYHHSHHYFTPRSFLFRSRS